MATDPLKADAALTPIARKPRAIRIFTYPKIIFMYPSFFAALLCGFLMMLFPDQATRAAGATTAVQDNTTAHNVIGIIFLGVFAFNMVVMAMDFPRFTIVAGILLVSTVGLLLVVIADWGFNVIQPITYLFGKLHLLANREFYFAFAVIMFLVYSTIFITRWLDYWEIRPNEILHHHGPLSDLERYPTFNLKFDKEIPDVFEFLMARSGRLVLTVANEQRSIVLDNVPFINTVEERLKNMMSEMKVSVGGDSNP